MNTYFNKVVRTLLGALVLFSCSVFPAFAQTTIGLQLKPAIVEDKVIPGETHQYSLTVTNISAALGTFYLTAKDIKGVDDQGRPIFSNTGEVTGYELSSWITLPQTSLTLNPGESKNIAFSVQIPLGASPGSHFASIFFNDKPIQPTSSGTGVGFDVGSIVSLRIAGNIHEVAQLREFSTSKLIYANPNVDFSSKVQNLGNVLVQPMGVIQISNMFGREIASVPVNTQFASVFPNSSRTYAANWKSDTFAFGRYQAIVSLVYGDTERKTIYSTTSFWVLPLVPILLVLGSLLILVLCIYVLMKSFVRRKLRQMGVVNVSRADADFYSKKYQKTSSRFVIVTMAIILLCVVFLMMMFLLFA